MILLGPSNMMHLPNSSYLVLLGLGILGFSCGMIIIPILPNMIQAIEERYPNMDEE